MNLGVGMWVRYLHFRRFVREFVPQDAAWSVLDAGFGQGQMAGWLAQERPACHVLGYDLSAGSHYADNLDAAQGNVRSPNVSFRVQDLLTMDKFTVVLAGGLPAEAARIVAEAGLTDWVRLPGLIPQIDALRLLYRSNLLLMSDPPGDGQLYVRGKLYEYLGSGRPVLALLPPGASRALLERVGAGVVVEPGDAAALAEALRGFIAGRVTLTPADPAEFAYANRTEQVAQVLRGVMPGELGASGQA